MLVYLICRRAICCIFTSVRATPGWKMMRPRSASSARKSFLSHAERWALSLLHSYIVLITFIASVTKLCVFVLQHHCRNCGDIYCNSCSSNELALPSYPRPVRVCDMCHSFLLQRSSSTPSWQNAYKGCRTRHALIHCWSFIRSSANVI